LRAGSTLGCRTLGRKRSPNYNKKKRARKKAKELVF
jgi:hypothetical protein